MPNLADYLSKNGPLPWRQTLSEFSRVLDSEAGKNLSLPLSTSSFSIDPETKSISINEEAYPRDYKFESPEACLERPCDERSFIYSFGCVLYACLLGSPPFKETKVERLKEMQICETPLPLSIRSIKNDFPPELAELIDKALQKDPQLRFEDRTSLVSAMNDIASNAVEIESESKPAQKPVLKVLAVMAALPVLSFGLSHNFFTQKLIADSHPSKKQPYHLSIESGDYRSQMEFEGNKLEPEKGQKPIQILNLLTRKIMFATTKRKSFKEALEEAVRRKLDLKGADLSNQDLSGVNLHGARLSKSFFSKCNLKNANLYACFLDGAIFDECNMENCMLQDVQADQTDFSKSNLSSSKMMNGFFLRANFQYCNLSKCDFTNAKLNQAKVDFADFTDAVLNNVSRSFPTWESAKVTKEQLDKTIVVK